MSKGIVELVSGAAIVAGSILATIFTAGLSAPLLESALSMGISLMLVGIGTLLTKTPGVISTCRNPIKAFDIVYGETQVQGTVIYLTETGSSNKYLHLVSVLAAHGSEALGNNYGSTFDGVYFDNHKILFIPESGNPLIGDSQTTDQTTKDINSITRVNNVVTVVASGPMPLAVGDDVVVKNITSDITLNGTWTIQTMPSNDTFSYLCGGEPISIDGGEGEVETSFINYGNTVHVEVALGNQSTSNPPFPGLLQSGDMGSGGEWTNQHLCYGMTAVYLRIKYDSTIYAAGLPNITFRLSGKNNIFDPRTNTTGYSNNAALCIADYLSSSWGMKATYGTEIPYAQLISDANICDEAVTLAAGGTEPRYALNGTFDIGTTRGQILSNLLTSCGGRLTYSGGQFAINAAAWRGSSLTFAPTGVGQNLIVPSVPTYYQVSWEDQYGGGDESFGNCDVEVYFDGAGNGTVKYLGADAGTLYLDDCGYNNTPLVGDNMDVIGPVSMGTTFVTGQIVSLQLFANGDHNPAHAYYTGPASNNPDNTIHARIGTAYYTASTELVPLGPLPIDLQAISTGAYVWKPKLSSRDLYNAVSGKFISLANKYANSDFPYYAQDQLHGYSNGPADMNYDVNLAQDLGDRRYLQIQAPFTNSTSCVQRLAKLALMRLRQQGTGLFPLNLTAYQVAPLDVATVTLPALNWTQKLLEVSAFRLTLNKQESGGGSTSVTIGCELEVQETDPAVYDWSTAEELSFAGYAQGGIVAPGASTSTPAAPSNLALASGAAQSIVGADGVARSQIAVTWTAPADGYVNSVQVQYQVVGASTWTSAPSVSASVAQAFIPGVVDGQSYNVQIASTNVQGATGAWVQAGPITVSGTASVISPTGLASGGAATGDVLEWNGTAWAAAEPASGGGGGSGALVLLEEHTASTSASLAFTSWCSTTYDDYLIELINVASATPSSAGLVMTFSTNAGTSYSTSNYQVALSYQGSHGDSGSECSYTASAIQIDLIDTTMVSGTVKLYAPGSSSNKLVTVQAIHLDNNGYCYACTGVGMWASSSAVNAFQISFTSGDIGSGTVRVYGLTN